MFAGRAAWLLVLLFITALSCCHGLDCGGRTINNVAIAIFGLTRSLNFTITNFRTHLLDPLTLADVNYTIFLHTYNKTVITNPRSKEKDVVVNPMYYKLLKPDVMVMDDEDVVKDIGSRVDSYLTQGDPWPEDIPHHTSLKNFLAQLHSLERVTELWAPNAADFDAVIYTRSDLWFFRPLNLQHLCDAAMQPEPTIYLANFHKFGGENDRFAFGNPQAMEAYGSRNRLALEFSQREPLHAERFLKNAIKENNLNAKYTDAIFARVRSHGGVKSAPVVSDNGTVIGLYANLRKARINGLGVVWSPAGYWMFSAPPVTGVKPMP